MKREARYQVFFNHWLRTAHQKTGAYELKQTQGVSIAFSAVKEHQRRALLIAKHGTLVHKITDFDIGWKPFDCFSFHKAPAFVVLFFKKNFYLIDIDVFLEEERTSTRKSITEQRAKELSTTI